MSLFVNGLNKLRWEQEASVGGTAKKNRIKTLKKLYICIDLLFNTINKNLKQLVLTTN